MAEALEKACCEIVESVEGALGCAVVDVDSGLLVAIHHVVPYFTRPYVDAVASAAVDMFRGRGIAQIEALLSEHRGVPVRNSILEIQMTTAGTHHFMVLIPKNLNSLVVLITDRKANLATGWTAIRNTVAKMAPHCP